MRVLHFSDVHVSLRLLQVPWVRWLSKRAIGGANLVLRRRGRRFAAARPKLAALAEFAKEHRPDLVIFSGDYTAMGLDREYADVRRAVEPLMGAPRGYVNVPGNHDLYTPDVTRRRLFEHHFGDTLESDLPEHRADGPWPLTRLTGEGIAVVCVNSSRVNLPWRSNGHIPRRQLEALGQVLADERLRDRFVFVVTHYAPRLANGGPDTRLHGLTNADAFLAACKGVARGAILCGHVHHRYHVRVPESPLPIFCAGSATIQGREAFWLFDVGSDGARAIPGRWTGEGYVVDETAAVDV